MRARRRQTRAHVLLCVCLSTVLSHANAYAMCLYGVSGETVCSQATAKSTRNKIKYRNTQKRSFTVGEHLNYSHFCIAARRKWTNRIRQTMTISLKCVICIFILAFAALYATAIKTVGRWRRHGILFSLDISRQLWTNFCTMNERTFDSIYYVQWLVFVVSVALLLGACHTLWKTIFVDTHCECDNTIFVVLIFFSWYDFECWSVLFGEGLDEMAMSRCEYSSNALSH